MLPKLKHAVVLVALSLPAYADNLTKRIEAAMQEELADSGTPSLQVAIARDGKILYSGAAGLADVENQVKAHRLSRYRSASVSKWFTAVATLKLVEQGTLSLDTPVRQHCDAFPDKGVPVKVRQILHHSSGIRHYVDHQVRIDAAGSEAEKMQLQLRAQQESLSSYLPSPDINDSLKTFAADPLLFEPGSDWRYSSHAYRVLGCVLEGASGKDYNSLLSSSVFAPAGMSNTLPDDARQLIPHRVRGYRVRDNKLAHNAELRDVSDNLPGGGHLTTAEDLVRLAQAFASNALVSGASRQLMTAIDTPLENRKPHWRDAIPAAQTYGLGLMLFPSQWGTWYGHTGRQAGGSAIVMHHPEHNVSIAVLTNAKGWRGYISFTEILATLLLKPETQV